MVTTFAIVSGVVGANLSPIIIIILGFVSLLADGVSMGASRFLSIRVGSDKDAKKRGIKEPLAHASATFTAFVILGSIPLLAYLIPNLQDHAFLISAILTGVTLFIVGSLRYFVTQRDWLRSGLEVLFIGAAAASVAYIVGLFLGNLLR